MRPRTVTEARAEVWRLIRDFGVVCATAEQVDAALDTLITLARREAA